MRVKQEDNARSKSEYYPLQRCALKQSLIFIIFTADAVTSQYVELFSILDDTFGIFSLGGGADDDDEVNIDEDDDDEIGSRGTGIGSLNILRYLLRSGQVRLTVRVFYFKSQLRFEIMFSHGAWSGRQHGRQWRI